MPPNVVREIGPGDRNMVDDYGFTDEWMIGVHSIICDGSGPDEHICEIEGFPRGDARRSELREERVGNIGAVFIEEDMMPEETWETMGETGLVWVDRGESPYGKDLPECEVRSQPGETRDVIVCYDPQTP